MQSPPESSRPRETVHPDYTLTQGEIKHTGDTHDTLARITFTATGSTITVIGPVVQGSTEYTKIFGLGYWGRVLNGFSDAGQLIEMHRRGPAGQRHDRRDPVLGRRRDDARLRRLLSRRGPRADGEQRMSSR